MQIYEHFLNWENFFTIKEYILALCHHEERADILRFPAYRLADGRRGIASPRPIEGHHLRCGRCRLMVCGITDTQWGRAFDNGGSGLCRPHQHKPLAASPRHHRGLSKSGGDARASAANQFQGRRRSATGPLQRRYGWQFLHTYIRLCD